MNRIENLSISIHVTGGKKAKVNSKESLSKVSPLLKDSKKIGQAIDELYLELL